mmetsp:Transcript_10047/g.22569  ORF Transcript_10047/g.22569 Transcript_10047/m.22569 type:complete len:409 (+) Transcript_10047:131-1357(+)|eukprot:CAMPEP_0178383732 /NCGR_PEP_ID=MMETSP0689_2-20121128/7150_1 /TAXON_ID=160604 /ORGANISM="Amphidinium massartii, Strain CS-259" /LENGTH=408 /DNA_ID=CAMNT_0020003955 /DNA_START=22 /DNA_END=1248 /DNA_ORIENTATION=+
MEGEDGLFIRTVSEKSAKSKIREGLSPRHDHLTTPVSGSSIGIDDSSAVDKANDRDSRDDVIPTNPNLLRRATTSMELETPAGVPTQRLIHRDSRDRQSSGDFNIRRVGKSFAVLLWHDVYHVILSLTMIKLLPFFAAVYLFFYTLFAGCWLWVAAPCHVGVETFREAFYLSVETMTTIGYGVPDPYFNDCAEALPVILIQSFVGLFLDVVVLNIVFQRVSRASARSASVVFSDTAVMRTSADGRIRLCFRVCDMRHRPLLEAWVRIYCVWHVVHPDHPDMCEVRVAGLKLAEPNNEVAEGRLFLALPMTIEHEVDVDSPLAPPSMGNGHLLTMEEVEHHMASVPFLEIIACLVGNDELTGASTEARHSYTKAEIHFRRRFSPCMRLDAKGYHLIDFPALHATVPEAA